MPAIWTGPLRLPRRAATSRRRPTRMTVSHATAALAPAEARMEFSFALLINAIVAGLLLGGFYAAVTAGISISFGMLDIVNIAHPAFIILGSYIAYIVNVNLGIDPIVVSVIVLPVFYALGALVYQVYYLSFEKRGQESLRGLAFFFGLLVRHRGAADPGVRRRLPLGQRRLYRPQPAPSAASSCRCGMLVPCLASLAMFAAPAALPVAQLHRPRDHGGVAGPAGAAADGGRSDPHQAHRLRHFDRHRLDGRRLPDHHPAGDPLGRPRLYRPHLRHLRAGRARQPARHLDRGACCSACSKA